MEAHLKYEDLPENEKVLFLYDKLEITHNTGVGGITMPMLATDWNKVKSIPYPVIVEPKLDGVRCLLIVRGEEGPEITFLSRSGKEYTSLQHIANDIISAWDPHQRITSGFILDGEIYSDELNFQEIVSAVKAYKPNSEKLKFHVYDIVTDDEMHKRRIKSRELVESIGSEFITHIEHSSASDKAGVIELHNQFVQQGYEGAMIRFYNGSYAQGSRSRELLKVKEFNETEFALVSWEFGQRGVEDLLAVCWNENGIEFRAKMVGTLAQKQEIYNSTDLTKMQLLLTVKHFGFTEDGLPRFPIGKSIRDY